GFAIRMAITAFGLWLAARWVPGIEIASGATLLFAALWLGVVNAVVRPVVVFLTLPLTILTLGLFVFAINAAMLGLVAWLLDGFRIASFGAALLGSLIVAITGWIGSGFVGPKGRYEVMIVRARRDGDEDAR
ncbi:MAG: phage holin family protein, partial [Myxococcales bacterium]|nr:phage holin family protein [Myxococcales bacterium]